MAPANKENNSEDDKTKKKKVSQKLKRFWKVLGLTLEIFISK